ncbi:MAG: sugar phosphate isomerase/epimerase [Ruminococcaceae bacterium]|nr:sugar phosphate isomerase/epimerase [Oscillospiraceae bacterium]
MLKIGIAAGNYVNADGSTDTARLRRYGYGCVDYGRLCSTRGDLYTLAEEQALTLLRQEGDALRREGILPWQVHGPWPYDDTTEEGRAAKWAHCLRAVKGTAALGSSYLIMHPVMPYGFGGPEDADKAEEMNEAFFRELCAFALPHGVTVCLENMPFKAQRISPVERIAAFVERLSLPNLAICLDTGHANMYRGDMGDYVRCCGRHLKALHVHDNNTRDDAHAIPYVGSVNWEHFKEGLRDVGFDGCLSLECNVRQDYPPHLAEEMHRTIARVAAYLADI